VNQDRKKMLFTSVASALVLTLVGCAGSGSPTSESSSSAGGDQSSESKVSEINVLSLYKKTGDVPEGAAINLAVDSFISSTGVSVNFTEAGENLGEEFEATVLAGQEADVVIVNLFDKSSGWLDAGATIAVNDLIAEWGLDSVIKESAIKEWTNSSGEVQGFPFQGFTWPVWYNMDLLAKAGITAAPQTMDQLIAATEALRAAGIGPMVVGGNDWSGNKLWLQFAQMFMDKTEAADVYSNGGFCASPNAMKGISEFVKARDAGVFVDGVEGYTADTMNAAYYAQDAAIMPAGSWAMSGAEPEIAAVTELGGLPVPSGAAYTKPTAYEGFTGVGFFITKKGAQKLSAVKDFILSFYQPDVIGKFVAEVNVVPATTNDISEYLAAASPLLGEAVSTMQTKVEFALMPDVYVGTHGDALTRASALAYGPGVSADQICKAADQAYN
jgi:multiple sugar transport system substrate-binding protein